MYRWEFESIIDDYTTKMNTDEAKDIVKKRGSIVEHPFGRECSSICVSHLVIPKIVS